MTLSNDVLTLGDYWCEVEESSKLNGQERGGN